MVIKQNDQIEKRKKLDIVINDYVQNYKTVHPAPFLLFQHQQQNNFDNKSMQISGVSQILHVQQHNTVNCHQNSHISQQNDISQQQKHHLYSEIFIGKIKKQYKIKMHKIKQITEMSETKNQFKKMSQQILKVKKSTVDFRDVVQNRKRHNFNLIQPKYFRNKTQVLVEN